MTRFTMIPLRTRSPRSTLFALPLIAATLPACESAREPDLRTTIVLVPDFDDSWELTRIELQSEQHHSLWPKASRLLQSGEEIRIVLQDPSDAGRPLPIVAWGLRDQERVAHGQVEVTAQARDTVKSPLPLSLLPCGDWCSPKTTECEGDAVRTCVRRDGCTEWSAPEPCPADAPYCSLGQCGVECVDECAKESSQCSGPSAVRHCGQADGDPCLDWLQAEPCPNDQICDRGTCVDAGACHDDCAPGETRCSGNAVATCGHHDADECLDWGPPVACPEGQSCNAGVCDELDACVDDCTQGVCASEQFRPCGQFDLDPCQDLGPPTSCVPDDPCLVAGCDPAAGCHSKPMVCNEPPQSQCVDEDHLQVFASIGTCEQGVCVYETTLVPCPNCPACDPCDGIVCDDKQPCFQGQGTCHDGVCHYDFADGEECNDGDDCTVQDRCESGVCSGQAMVCDTPADPTCMNAWTLHEFQVPGTCVGGQCSYVEAEVVCPNGCVAGACGCVPVDVSTGIHEADALPSVASDLTHGVHVSFRNTATGALEVAHRALDGSWTTDPVTSPVRAGPSLAMDASGGLHVTYVTESGQLGYGFRAPTQPWQAEVVDPDGGFANPRIALDAWGDVHVVYAHESGRVSHATRPVGGSWQIDSFVCTDGLEMTDLSMAVDAQGGVHVSLVADHGIGIHTLDYLYRGKGGAWEDTEVVWDLEAVPGSSTSVLPDASGGAIIVYRDATSGLRVARVKPGQDAVTTPVGPMGQGPFHGRFPALGRTPGGAVQLVYASGPTVWRMRATNATASDWEAPEVLSQVGVASGCSLSLDEDGASHVAFADTGTQLLHHARDCP